MTGPRTTPTGIPIVSCRDCGTAHPTTRHHCLKCGRPSLFLDATGECLQCRPAVDPEPFELMEPTYD